jgi:putative flippase GtrA
MFKTLAKYAVVGGFNTFLHWVTFAAVYYSFSHDQMISNFAGFCVAVTFSFFANARWTFKSDHTAVRYFMYVGFMGLLALACGYMADRIGLNPVITLVAFSAISLFVGFIYSNYVVFREKQ